MDWNDYLTVIFGYLAAILTIIQFYQVLPRKIRLSFAEIKVLDTTSKVSPKRILAIIFRAENNGNKDIRFDFSAKIMIHYKDKKYIFDKPEKILKNEEIISKKSITKVLHFEIPLDYDKWFNPKLQFTYSYIKSDKIITKSSRWKKGIRGEIELKFV